MLRKDIAYKLFQFAWVYFLLITIIDFHYPLGKNYIPIINFSKIQNFKYIPFVVIALLILPLSAYKTQINHRLFKIFLVIAILIISGFVSASLSENPRVGFAFMIRFTIYFLILLYLIFALKYFAGLNEFLIKSFVYVNLFIVIACIMDFYVPAFHQLLIEYFGRPLIKHSFMKYNGEILMRPMGFITEANLAALSISLASLIILLNNKKFNAYFRIIFYVLSSFTLGMLVSRSSLIFSIIILVYLFFSKKIVRKELYAYVSIFIVLQILTPQTQSRILQFFDKKQMEEEVSVGRPLIWQADINAFKEKPFFGVGPDCFFHSSQDYLREVLISKNININNPSAPNYFEINNVNPHSLILAVLTESGIIGFIIFTILILLIFLYYLREKLYTSMVFFANLLIAAALSSYAPYYTFFLLITVIFFIISLNNMCIENTIEDTKE
jgi:O-antigen ligase